MTEQSQCLIEQRISAESFSFYWIIIDLDVGSSIHSERFTRRLCNGKMNLFRFRGTTLTLPVLSMGALLMFYLENFRVLSRHPLSPPSRQKLHLKRHHFYPFGFFSFQSYWNRISQIQHNTPSLRCHEKCSARRFSGNLRKRCRKSSNWIIPRLLKAFKLSLPQ